MPACMRTVFRRAFIRRGTPFRLGMTSHARGFTNYPQIPWKPFIDVSDTLYPQTYWRYDAGSNGQQLCTNENPDPVTHQNAGTPSQAVINGFPDYKSKGLPIVPIAGEIACARPGEMTAFGQLVAQRHLAEAHFYVDADETTFNAPDVLAEIKALQGRLERLRRPVGAKGAGGSRTCRCGRQSSREMRSTLGRPAGTCTSSKK
jgi:hypothetical protein